MLGSLSSCVMDNTLIGAESYVKSLVRALEVEFTADSNFLRL